MKEISKVPVNGVDKLLYKIWSIELLGDSYKVSYHDGSRLLSMRVRKGIHTNEYKLISEYIKTKKTRHLFALEKGIGVYPQVIGYFGAYSPIVIGVINIDNHDK